MPDISDKFEGALIQFLTGDENLKRADIEAFAVKLAHVLGMDKDSLDKDSLDIIIRNVESKLVTTMSEGIALIDPNTDHDDEWCVNRDDIKWNYWEDYASQLSPSKLSLKVVHTLGDVTEKILGLLKDPQESSDWNRRGLVIGHVQSGKTANYIGLISKAADAGYKFIIVIAGIHNNLRKQTQIRIDEGFVGRDSTPGRNRKPVGVGVLNVNRKHPIALTTTDKDFTKHTATQLVADLQGFSQPVVIVIKKNMNTLNNLSTWLKDLNLRGSTDKIADIPMLMIDDEADHASINTKEDDLNPTRTNQAIRKILNLFRKSCYIGYTATPFANIFINPDSENEMLGDDLFPRDFIYCLDTPTNYFGPNKVFLDEESSDSFLCTINDAEDYIGLSHKKDWKVPDLPPSMKQAINAFVIGKAIRIVRKQGGKHCSMMINASRFTNVQQQIRDQVSHYLKTMARAIRYSHALPEEQALKNEHMADLKKSYDDEFSNIRASESWQEIQEVSATAADSIKIRLINSNSGETLDYKRSEESNGSLTVIAVGGLSLSRGLTLEGLIVSYMYRNTKMYDTLMQMGRWFGYRDSFEDICRIWLSDESQGWYSHIAEATEELRQQIKQMQRDRRTPKEFGLSVRSHPDALTVTALNKMRDTESIDVRINFSSKLAETVIVPSDEKITEENRQVIADLFEKLNADQQPEKCAGNYFWKDVGWEKIEEFLIGFRFHKQLNHKKDAVLEYLRKIADKYPNVDVAFISLQKRKEDSTGMELGKKMSLLCQTRAVGTFKGKIRQSVEGTGFYITNKQRVGSRGVEAVGLTDVQRKQAKKDAKDAGDAKNVADRYYRAAREKPLLMIHLLKLVHKNQKTKEETVLLDKVPAIGISFPKGNYTDTVKYVVNKVWLQQDIFDSPDEEDDYDS